MKTKKEISYQFQGWIEAHEVAKAIYDKCKVRVMLEKSGQTVNGYVNCYYPVVDGKQYTLVDVFLYDEDVKIKENKKNNIKKHYLKKKEISDLDKFVKKII